MEIVYTGISFLVGIGVVIPYVVKLQNLLKEVAELIVKVKDAPDDGINAADIAEIKKEAIDVWVAIKAFGKKK